MQRLSLELGGVPWVFVRYCCPFSIFRDDFCCGVSLALVKSGVARKIVSKTFSFVFFAPC